MATPIERMVDEACGVSAAPPYDVARERDKRALVSETLALLAVADAAKSWWESRAEHGLEDPQRMTIERNLSEAVEELVRLGW